MDSLNQLFQDILHSEQSFNNRLTFLKELNCQIESAQRELLTERDTTQSLRGQLVVKRQSLADCETSCQLAQLERRVAEEKKNELDLINKDLKNKLDKLSDSTDYGTEKQRQEMMSELVEFDKCYDLTGSGINFRENQTQKQLELLEEEMSHLETEYSQYKYQKNLLNKLETNLTEQEKEVLKQQKIKSTLQDEVYQLKIEMNKLESEKVLLNEQLNEDSELRKLKQELESCRNDPIEKKCNQLKEEVEILQQKCYKKQMKYAQRGVHTPRHVTSKEVPQVNHVTTTTSKLIDLTQEDEEEESDWELLDDTDLVQSLDVIESLHHLNEGELDDFESSSSEDEDLFELQVPTTTTSTRPLQTDSKLGPGTNITKFKPTSSSGDDNKSRLFDRKRKWTKSPPPPPPSLSDTKGLCNRRKRSPSPPPPPPPSSSSINNDSYKVSKKVRFCY